MAARVIHFGLDDCHRVLVLRSAGYAVRSCHSLQQLQTTLGLGPETDAVLVSDDGDAAQRAAALARSRSAAPVVLFRSTNLAYEHSSFDLVVPTLTPPEVWLNEVHILIARNRELRRRSERPHVFSSLLRREPAEAVEEGRTEQGRSDEEYSPECSAAVPRLFEDA